MLADIETWNLRAPTHARRWTAVIALVFAGCHEPVTTSPSENVAPAAPAASRTSVAAAALAIPALVQPSVPAVEYLRLETKAGLLHCAPGLCENSDEPLEIEHGAESLSTHRVRWHAQSAPVRVLGSEGLSGDFSYMVDDRNINGEDAYVPGDGCLYVRQIANADFPITKRFCVGADGKLERKAAATHPMQHSYRLRTPTKFYSTPENAEPLATIPRGELLFATLARVEEASDSFDTISWLRVQRPNGSWGWIRYPQEQISQCSGFEGNLRTICFAGD